MRIIVHAKPNSHKEDIENIGEHEYHIAVKEPPIQGRANRAIIGLLGRYFNVPVSSVRLVAGFSSRRKIFEIF